MAIFWTKWPESKEAQMDYLCELAKGSDAEKVVAKFIMLLGAAQNNEKTGNDAALVVAMASAFGCRGEDARKAVSIMAEIGLRVQVV